jgi:hypothetical protein
MIQQTHWRKGAFKYYFKFIANFTNHTLGILKPKYCSLGLRAGHYWPWISVYFEGIAANKQGIDSQWPPLNSRPGLWKLQLVWKLDSHTMSSEDPYYFQGKDFERKFPVSCCVSERVWATKISYNKSFFHLKELIKW